MIDLALLTAFFLTLCITQRRNALVALFLIIVWFPTFHFIDSWFWIQVASSLSCAIACRLCNGRVSLVMLLFSIFCFISAVDAIVFPTESTFIYNIYQISSFALNLLLLHELGRDDSAKLFNTGSVSLTGSICNSGRIHSCQKRVP